MKFTKLSLSAMLALSTMTTMVMAEDTTIAGKAQVYYYTNDNSGTEDLGANGRSKVATAFTLDVAHKLSDSMTANFTAVGFTDLGDDLGADKFEGKSAGAFFNVANLTGSFGETTVVAGRQLLSTPMITGFDWLLAPGAFEAITLMNTSVDKLTFVASYINRFRGNNTGDNFVRLGGDNYGVGLGYDDAVNANLWYYNIDSANYTQTYLDMSKTFGPITVAAQGVQTDYETADDATVYGAKVSGSFSGIDASLAYNKLQGNDTGYVGVDGLYTSSWNSFAASSRGAADANAYKVDLSKEFGPVSATASYANYDNDANEIDVILGYTLKENLSFGAIYSNTTYAGTTDADQALELIGTYTF